MNDGEKVCWRKCIKEEYNENIELIQTGRNIKRKIMQIVVYSFWKVESAINIWKKE